MVSPATLSVQPTSPKARVGEDLKIQVALTNKGSQPLWLNARMLVNTSHAPASMREVWFDVTGPDGSALPFLAKIRAGEAEARDYRALAPGESQHIEVPLSEYFRFAKPGRYNLVLHYQDGRSNAPEAPAGAVRLAQHLTTSPLVVEIQ